MCGFTVACFMCELVATEALCDVYECFSFKIVWGSQDGKRPEAYFEELVSFLRCCTGDLHYTALWRLVQIGHLDPILAADFCFQSLDCPLKDSLVYLVCHHGAFRLHIRRSKGFEAQCTDFLLPFRGQEWCHILGSRQQ